MERKLNEEAEHQKMLQVELVANHAVKFMKETIEVLREKSCLHADSSQEEYSEWLLEQHRRFLLSA